MKKIILSISTVILFLGCSKSGPAKEIKTEIMKDKVKYQQFLGDKADAKLDEELNKAK